MKLESGGKNYTIEKDYRGQHVVRYFPTVFVSGEEIGSATSLESAYSIVVRHSGSEKLLIK